jgi:Ni,Fe-hydrogenase I large subunit
MFDWAIATQSAATLYIYRVRRYCPIRSRNPYKTVSKYSSDSVYNAQTRLNRLVHAVDVHIFQKSYLPHPNSKLDVL